jgi:hypothetical protein
VGEKQSGVLPASFKESDKDLAGLTELFLDLAWALRRTKVTGTLARI